MNVYLRKESMYLSEGWILNSSFLCNGFCGFLFPELVVRRARVESWEGLCGCSSRKAKPSAFRWAELKSRVISGLSPCLPKQNPTCLCMLSLNMGGLSFVLHHRAAGWAGTSWCHPVPPQTAQRCWSSSSGPPDCAPLSLLEGVVVLALKLHPL